MFVVIAAILSGKRMIGICKQYHGIDEQLACRLSEWQVLSFITASTLLASYGIQKEL